MPIFNGLFRTVLGALVCCAILGAGSARAFDPDKVFKHDQEPRTILRYGFQALKNGRVEEAVNAFKFGAVKNHVASKWKLAQMLQTGDGVTQDHYAAYELFSEIANQFAEIPPTKHDLPFVSHAVYSLGHYSMKGIKGAPVEKNIRAAEGYFYRAGALYHNADAEYRLGEIYRKGMLGEKRPRSAARWLELAARKGHARAQAKLGKMLFYGEGVRRNPVRGLAYMTKAAARRGARQSWKSIEKMRREAFEIASESQRKMARIVVEKLRLKEQRRRVGPPPASAVEAVSAAASN